MRSSAFSLSGGSFLVSRDLFVSAFLVLFPAVVSVHVHAAAPEVAGSKTSQVTVVDIMPESLSGEIDNDTEPNIAVNPANPMQIAASAFTREPLRADKAPIFVSTDGGQSWSCRSIVPSPQITCDITLRFGSSSNVLYVSALRNEVQGYKNYELIICQSTQYANARVMNEIFNHRNFIDQPYIAAVTAASKDHVFVGDKDYNYKIEHGQAAIDRSLDCPRGIFTPFTIESRNDPNDTYMDGSEVRPAMSTDGKVVYAAFNRVTSVSNECSDSWSAGIRKSDVVVVRDDNGGASTQPFSDLVDPTDNKAGVRAVKERIFAWDKCLGGDRLGGDLAIAVHPGDPNKVYLVWSDWVNDRTNLHLAYSTNGGQNWSDSKRDIADAKNPGLAVNARGTVGFLYQQVVNTPEGYVWMTQFERTTDDFKTTPTPLTLAKFPIKPPLYRSCCDGILLGDYLHLMSVRNDFYGIFSSNNTPDLLRFRYGVTFLRKTDFNSKKLFDQQGKDVCPSIDPFFFKVSE